MPMPVAWLLLLHLSSGTAVRQHMHRMAARANKLALLLAKPADTLTVAEAKELSGLQSTETYDESEFTAAHAAFKASHNRMLIDLARDAAAAGSTSHGPCFFLDGPGGGTTSALLAAGFEASNLFTANWHPSTVVTLRRLLPESHVAAATASEALRSQSIFGACPFSALYIDGCGGAPEPIIECIEALFDERHKEINQPRIAFGFTLTVAERTGRSLADREVAVQRALSAACRRTGYAMAHVSDAPELYKADASTAKREGNTLTTWHMCERR
jgi:hypothetical protein